VRKGGPEVHRLVPLLRVLLLLYTYQCPY
jgi:hypothetical protein